MKTNALAIWTAAVLVSLIFTAQAVSRADDWTQWRGPNRDGAVSFKPPKKWPEKLKLKWKVDVGHGDASPVMAGKRVFLFTNQGQRETITAVNLADGRQVWQDSYLVRYTQESYEKEHGKGPKATPVVHGGRLFTVGVTGVITAYDAATGKQLWRKEPKGGLKEAYPVFGMSVSPLIVNDLLIAPVGGNAQSKLTAFDARTGEVKWEWGAENLHPELGLGYSSPMLAEIAGARQIIFWSGRDIVGLDPQSGKQLWGFPFKSQWDNVVTPVLHDGMVIVSGNPQGIVAVKVNKQGDAWRAEQAWAQADAVTYMNTPVVSQNMLYGLSIKKKGQYFCIDLADGKTRWLSEGKEAEHASLISAGDSLFIFTDDAKLIVAKGGGQGFEMIRRYEVASSPVWAHPILLDRQILVKDATTLALWSFE